METNNLTLTNEEFSNFTTYTKKVLALLNGIAYTKTISAISTELETPALDWAALILKHHHNLNHSHISLLISELIRVKNSDLYDDESITEIPFNAMPQEIKALKQVVHDFSNLANLILIGLADHKRKHKEDVDAVRALYKEVSAKYGIYVPKEINEEAFMDDSIWMHTYQVCKYIHDHYIEFVDIITRIQAQYPTK
jgi:hypothetical protein